MIGGLYSTDESVSRRGIPILKDLPWWFFGLRYVFGYEQTTLNQKELLIVLQAEVLDPLIRRADLPMDKKQLDLRREKIRDVLERAGFSQQAREVPETRR